MHDRWRALGAVLLLTALIGWVFHESLFQQHSLVPTDLLNQLVAPFDATNRPVRVQYHYAMDVIEQDYPWAVLWQQSRGVPLWNSQICGGQPHLATSMAGVLNPLRLLLLVLPVERAITLGIVLSFLLSALLMLALLRELRLSWCAALIGSSAFALNTAFIGWYWRLPGVFLWLPLTLFLFERSVRRQSWSYALAAGLALGVGFASGNLQGAVHFGFFCAAYFAASIYWREPAQQRLAIQRVAAVFLIGAMLSAVQWLPTLELMHADVGGRVDLAGPRPGLRHTLLGLPFLIGFVFPALAGSPETFDLAKVVGPKVGGFGGYIGIVPFALFVTGALASRDRRVRWLLGAMAVVVVIVFFTPLVKYLYHRLFIVAIIGMTIVAAYGTDITLADAARARRAFFWMTWLSAIVLAGLLVVQLVVHWKWDELVALGQRYVTEKSDATAFSDKKEWLLSRVPDFLHHYRITNPVFWIPLLGMPCAAWAWLRYSRQKISRSVLAVVLVALTMIDLSVMARTTLPQVDLRQFPLYPPLPALHDVQSDHDLFRVQQWSPNNWLLLPNNMLMVYGLETVKGYESLYPENLMRLPDHLFNLLNVKYVLADPAAPLPAPQFEPVAEQPGLRVYRNQVCLPRAQFLHRWQVVTDRQQILGMMAAPDFAPDRTALIEQPAPDGFQPAKSDATGAMPQVQIVNYVSDRVSVHVESTQAGMLLLSDTFYPGWRAEVDGQPAQLYRADYILRAVFVPAGQHDVEFIYAPLSFRIGAGASLFAIVAAITVWLFERRVSGKDCAG